MTSVSDVRTTFIEGVRGGGQPKFSNGLPQNQLFLDSMEEYFVPISSIRKWYNYCELVNEDLGVSSLHL
uniref:Uncharacterized protein n=1 Tax=Megaselia scalaris TaxID=36166 RepID=T1GAU9_MEGSC